MKLTKEHIGVKVRRNTWDVGTYLFFIPSGLSPVEEKYVVGGVSRFGFVIDDAWWINDDAWELYQEPKKKVKMAPSIIQEIDQRYPMVTDILLTENEAKNRWGKFLIRWPASPDLVVEVEE